MKKRSDPELFRKRSNIIGIIRFTDQTNRDQHSPYVLLLVQHFRNQQKPCSVNLKLIPFLEPLQVFSRRDRVFVLREFFSA